MIGPLKADELFTQEDFNLLEKYTMKTSAEKIKSKVKTMKLEDRQYVYSKCVQPYTSTNFATEGLTSKFFF